MLIGEPASEILPCLVDTDPIDHRVRTSKIDELEDAGAGRDLLEWTRAAYAASIDDEHLSRVDIANERRTD